MHCRPTIVRSLPATRVARLCPQARRVRPGLRAANHSRAGSNQNQKPVAYCLEDAYSSLESFAARMTQLTVPSLVLVFSERFKLLIPTITFSYCDLVDSARRAMGHHGRSCHFFMPSTRSCRMLRRVKAPINGN